MYRGDGRFSTKEIKLEKSLIDLLELEKEFVNLYNNKALAIEKAKKNSLNTTELFIELDKLKEKLMSVRAEISEYIHESYNTKTNLADILYSESEDKSLEVINLTRKPIGYDKFRNPVYKN